MVTKYRSPENIESIADAMRADLLGPEANDTREVDILKMANKLNCKVEVATFEPADVSAQVVRDPGNPESFTIQVSEDDSHRRQKFSIAHEIAHIILHDDGKSSFVELRQPLGYYDKEQLYKEVQANMLASALLLPRGLVKQAWKSTHDIDDVAEIFNVSKQAAYYRLENLGLLNE